MSRNETRCCLLCLRKALLSENRLPCIRVVERQGDPSPLRLRDKSTAHGLGLDQAVLKEEGIHPVGDASPRGVASPLEEEYIVHLDGLKAPFSLSQTLEN